MDSEYVITVFSDHMSLSTCSLGDQSQFVRFDFMELTVFISVYSTTVQLRGFQTCVIM